MTNDDTRSFRLRFGERQREAKAGFAGKRLPNPTGFSNYSEQLLDNIAMAISEHARNGRLAKSENVTPEDARQMLFLHDRSQEPLKLMVSNYNRCLDERNKLADVRRQEARATTIDHLKYVGARFLTTIVIAATVLGTSWVAREYQIPVPVLRAVPSVPAP